MTSLGRLPSFFLTLSASAGSFGFFAVQGIILARILGPAGRGVFAACVVFPQALLYVGLLGALELFAGFSAESGPTAKLRRSAALYGLAAGVLSTVVCIVLDILTIPFAQQEILPLAILCACSLPFQQVRLSVQAIDHGARNLTRYNQGRLLAAAAFPLTLVLAFAFGVFSDSRPPATVADTAVINTAEELVGASERLAEEPAVAQEAITAAAGHDLRVACILFFVAHLASLGVIRWGMDEPWIGPTAIPVRRALKRAKGLIGAWVTTEALERIDIVLVMILFADSELLGYYATAIPIAALMIIIPNSAGIYAFNKGARENEQLTRSEAWQFILLGLLIQAVCGCTLAVALPFLLPFIYGPKFSAAITFAWLLIPAGAFRGLLQAADSYLRARKKPGLGLRARLFAIPVLLIVSFAGAPVGGVYAVPVGLILAQLLCFVIVAAGVISDSTSQKLELA